MDANLAKHGVLRLLGSVFMIHFICLLPCACEFISGFIFDIKEVHYIDQRKQAKMVIFT